MDSFVCFFSGSYLRFVASDLEPGHEYTFQIWTVADEAGAAKSTEGQLTQTTGWFQAMSVTRNEKS